MYLSGNLISQMFYNGDIWVPLVSKDLKKTMGSWIAVMPFDSTSIAVVTAAKPIYNCSWQLLCYYDKTSSHLIFFILLKQCEISTLIYMLGTVSVLQTEVHSIFINAGGPSYPGLYSHSFNYLWLNYPSDIKSSGITRGLWPTPGDMPRGDVHCGVCDNH